MDGSLANEGTVEGADTMSATVTASPAPARTVTITSYSNISNAELLSFFFELVHLSLHLVLMFVSFVEKFCEIVVIRRNFSKTKTY